ncbi:G protein-activated inward rectifier potassium channel 3-like [Rhynchophorus ferrugineus]|uniref:G protein-activated inward rectifier potassium channel 3-like n=1 Tax=Rhynchophorus ferrugineus TaxID=354439 RepID=UPI003FCD5338
MVVSQDINEINSCEENDQNNVFPYYFIKNRPNVQRRRSSLQSWQQRNKVQIIRRLLRKSGKHSIHTKTTTEISFRFILDLFNTLIEGSWFVILLTVSLIFCTSWFMFAGFWAVISIENVENWNGTSDTCLEGINSFAGYLLFSIETQTTIGFGGRYINEYCIEAIVGLCIQLLFGVGVCGSLICIVFVKMGGPLHSRNSIVCFSRKAVICQRDGELSLIFRVRDYDRRYECHTRIAAFAAQRTGAVPTLRELKLDTPGILIWPVDVRHRIDADSPFWDVSAKDLITKRFEVIVVLEGESLTTSYMSRTMTSYVSREIKWGHKFKPCVFWNRECSKYEVNNKLFNKTEEVVTPLCSARRFLEVYFDVLSSTGGQTNSLSYPSSIYSSPSTVSPLVSKLETIHSCQEDNSSDDLGAIFLMTKADIERSDSETSDNDDGIVLSDLCFDKIEEKKKTKKSSEVELRRKDAGERPKTLTGTAKDFILSLVESSMGKNRSSKKYEETDF